MGDAAGTQGPIILESMLRRLADQRSGVTRQQMAEEIGISAGALSKYISGVDVPRLPTLVELARYFDVPLGYLVLGETSRQEMPANLVMEHVRSLTKLERSREELVSRFADRMADYAHQIAEDVHRGPIWPGVLSAGEVSNIEGKANRVDLLVPYLDEDIDGDGRPSSLMLSTGANINRGVDYRAIVDVRTDKTWTTFIPRYREMLHDHCGCPFDLIDSHFRIRQTDETIFAGFALYWLDDADYPTTRLAEQATTQGEDGYLFAFLQPAHLLSDAHSILRPERADAAVSVFDRLWEKATPVI